MVSASPAGCGASKADSGTGAGAVATETLATVAGSVVGGAETETETAATTPDWKIKIMFNCPEVNDPIWLVVREGLEIAGKDPRFEAVWMGANDHSVERIMETIENIIAAVLDRIICCPLSLTVSTNVLRKA